MTLKSYIKAHAKTLWLATFGFNRKRKPLLIVGDCV